MAADQNRIQEMRLLREKSVEELQAEVSFLAKSLFAARVFVLSRQVKDVSQVAKLRKSIARVKTVITEKTRSSCCATKTCCG